MNSYIFSCQIKPLIKYNHERVSVIQLICSDYNLVIINVYMPYLDRSNLQSASDHYDEILGYLDYIIGDIQDAHFIVLGDFNCNLYDSTHPFAASLNNFVTSRHLCCTYTLMESFDSNSTFTRRDSRSKSLLDYVFVSQSIVKTVTEVTISDCHDNLLDHLPIDIVLTLPMTTPTTS